MPPGKPDPKILIFSVNWLGDVIFLSPVFSNLRNTYPHARISCLALPRVIEILKCVPEIDEIIEFDERGKHRSFLARWKLAKTLRARRFDSAFLLRASISRALFLWLCGIPKRIGYKKNGHGDYLTQSVDQPTGTVHRSDQYLNLLESAGIPVHKKQTRLFVNEEAIQEAETILSQKGVRPSDKFIVLNPGGNWALKRWPAENYRELTAALLKEGVRVVVTGAQKDKCLVQKITEKNSAIDLSGQTTLKQLAAVLQRAAVVVSGDSGPLHIASSVGTSAVGLFGPTRPEVTAPRGRGKVRILQKDIGCNLTPCYFLDCPNNQCMQVLTVEDVLHAIKRISR